MFPFSHHLSSVVMHGTTGRRGGGHAQTHKLRRAGKRSPTRSKTVQYLHLVRRQFSMQRHVRHAQTVGRPVQGIEGAHTQWCARTHTLARTHASKRRNRRPVQGIEGAAHHHQRPAALPPRHLPGPVRPLPRRPDSTTLATRAQPLCRRRSGRTPGRGDACPGQAALAVPVGDAQRAMPWLPPERPCGGARPAPCARAGFAVSRRSPEPRPEDNRRPRPMSCGFSRRRLPLPEPRFRGSGPVSRRSSRNRLRPGFEAEQPKPVPARNRGTGGNNRRRGPITHSLSPCPPPPTTPTTPPLSPPVPFSPRCHPGPNPSASPQPPAMSLRHIADQAWHCPPSTWWKSCASDGRTCTPCTPSRAGTHMQARTHQ